ncbi:phage head closure protein [Burkholderia ubonensis]|uniref:phage head closure protein n=1 Tax=Burkholderia ubonensis TaxID=101571 RepID=UPI0007C72EC6|nr:phage head closure protein [Burkholderia ubonensis]
MRAGKLNRRVRIDRLDPDAQDEYGQAVPAWKSLGTVWAAIAQKSGLATISGSAEVGETKVSIRVRYRTDLHEGMRVTLVAHVNGQPVDVAQFKVDAVLVDHAKRKHTDLVCLGVDRG